MKTISNSQVSGYDEGTLAGVDLERLIVPRGAAPVFSLRSVTDFFHRNSPGLADKRLAKVDKDAF